MSRRAILRDIAHARTGDKGNTSNLSVFVYDPAHYEAVSRQLTPETLKRELGALLIGDVTRYELPLMREQLSAVTHLEVVEGISLAWGMPGWTRWVGRLPAAAAQRALATLDWVAQRVPSLADVVVLAGRPRQVSTTSS